MEDLEYLTEGLNLAVTKKVVPGGANRLASVGYSRSGRKYRGANVDSDTNLLNITSEQAVVALAAAHQDYALKEIVTLTEKSAGFIPNPISVKTMTDFCVRTGADIKYWAVDLSGQELFSASRVTELIPFYRPAPDILSKTKGASPSEARVLADPEAPIEGQLKKCALVGLSRCFTTEDSASGYGAAVLTEDGIIYYSGQYSSFDKRTNLHAEMAAVLLALMDGRTKITAVGVASSKYKDTPCEICGCCRQFLSEISAKQGQEIDCYCFATESEKYEKHSLKDLLPNQWSSKKWV